MDIKFCCVHCGQKMSTDKTLLTPRLECPNCHGTKIYPPSILAVPKPPLNSPQHHTIKKSLWQRWMEWSGSFFVISILLHVLLLGGATMLVVQVVQNRKEKMKFTAPPPSANASVEHKVKPSKKTAAAAPAISKRITSTAVNVSVALPSMDLNTTGPDVMSSVMSGMGASGLGAGGSGGAAGMASMPLAGLTAFGFRGATNGGLVGHFYDLSRNSDKTPVSQFSISTYIQPITEFFLKNWDDAVFKRYYCAHDSMLAVQIYMSCSGSSGAAKAFNVENEVTKPFWVIHYKGTVVAPFDGEFRFWGSTDDFMVIRFDGAPVFVAPLGLLRQMPKEVLPYILPKPAPASRVPIDQKADKINSGILFFYSGSWIRVQKGKPYPIDILIGDTGGLYQQIVMIQEKTPSTPYPTKPGNPSFTLLPLLQFRKGVPVPTYDPDVLKKLKGHEAEYGRNPEFAPFSVVFPAK